MSRRKTFEQLAMTRTQKRSARIRRMIEQIGYEWYDSEIQSLSAEADTLMLALDNFDATAKEFFDEYLERERES